MPAKTIFAALVALSLALLWAPSLKAEDADWYQVELIIFANKTPVQTDELWPLAALSYPARMVTIAPETSDALTPYSLEQLEELRRYLAIFNAEAEAPMESQSEDFLFESRNRFRVPTETATVPGTVPGSETENGTSEEPAVVINYEALFDNNMPAAFQSLPEAQRIMNSLARSIRRSSLYKTLLHESWVQPVAERDRAIPIMIQAGEHYDDQFELDGTVTISRSRFLHVETDLWYTEFAPLYQQDESTRMTTASVMSPSDRRQFPAIADWESNRGQYVPVHAHQMRQSRRMRSSTLHFIDHPQFGILVKIEDFERAAAD